MKTNTTQLMNQKNIQYKQFHNINNKATKGLAIVFSSQMDGFIRSCFSHLCLKGNRKSLTFLLPFHFAKKEGAPC